MKAETRIKALFRRETPTVIVSPRDWAEVVAYADNIGTKRDAQGRITLRCALGSVLVRESEFCPEDRMFLQPCSDVLLNIPHALLDRELELKPGDENCGQRTDSADGHGAQGEPATLTSGSGQVVKQPKAGTEEKE